MSGHDFVHLGTLTRAHGLKGEIGVFWHAESLEYLKGTIYLQSGENAPYRAEVAGLRFHKGHPLVLFKGVEDRNAAEAMRGQKVVIPREALPEPEAGEYYVVDIKGCEVYIADDIKADKKYFGVVAGVDWLNGREIWTLRNETGQEALFPAVPEFVLEVDIKAGKITVNPPPGLFELYIEN